MQVPLEQRRSQISEIPGGVSITIPSKTNWFVDIFLGFWLSCWAFGLFFVTMLLLSGKAEPFLFLCAWLLCWTFAGAFFLYTWLWNIAGKELIIIADSSLMLRFEVLGIGRTHDFELSQIKNMRTVPLPPFHKYRQIPLFNKTGTIMFDYGFRSYGFGQALDEPEAKILIDEIRNVMPLR